MKGAVVATISLLGGACAFQPTSFAGSALAPRTAATSAVRMSSEDVDRRAFLSSTAAAAMTVASAFVAPAFAEDAAPAKAPLGPMPTDWGLTKDYYTDASKVVSHMRYATSLEKGAAGIEMTAKNCRQEMIDFVSYYRRFPNVSGKLSYSNLYTSINVLAGHYASYGPKFPVPEKRRKRLLEEYNQIEKAIKRQR